MWGVIGDDLLEFPPSGARIARAGNSEEYIDALIKPMTFTGHSDSLHYVIDKHKSEEILVDLEEDK